MRKYSIAMFKVVSMMCVCGGGGGGGGGAYDQVFSAVVIYIIIIISDAHSPDWDCKINEKSILSMHTLSFNISQI